MADNAFLRTSEFYQRDINPIGQYVNQMAQGLSIQKNISFEEAKAFITESIKSRTFPGMRDPMVHFFGRDHNLDRTTEHMPLTHYIQDVKQNKQILVPTFTAYCNEEEEASPLSQFTGYNVSRRSKAKKEGQKAKDEGNLPLAFSKNIEQANRKENNNSLSGAFATDSSIFENETGHNTLTSITRSMASIGNALNERMLSGNRHYRTKDVVFNNIMAIVTTMVPEEVLAAVEKFNLHLPSPEEVVKMVRHSSRFYVFDKRVYEDLLDFAKKMTPIQRAAVVYNQDFYHIRQLNPNFVRTMLENFANIDLTKRYEDPIGIIKKTDALVVNYAHQVMIFDMQGKGKDYDKLDEATVNALAFVCQNIDAMVEHYRPLINAFFLTRTVPNSTAFIQDMVRQNVVLSDTDSTMFSTDEWVMWYFNKLDFSQRGFGISGAVMFMTTQCIAHCLAVLSGNMGVAKDKMFTLAMKPEFVFPVFFQSPVSKHYYTAKLVCEGSVYEDIEMEIKGVHNKNSALPVTIVKPAQDRMEEHIRAVMRGEQLSLAKEIKDAADIERKIINSLKNSEVEYLKRSNLKEASAYSRGAKQSNYAFHTLWMDVFAPTYGDIEPPPYDVVKVPTILKTPSVFNSWLNGMENKELAQRMRVWAEDHGKKKLTTFYFNLDAILAGAIPKEVVEVIDFKKIVMDLTNVRRMMLDTLGFTCRSDFMLVEQGY